MKNEKIKSFDGTVLQCYVWDDVRNPKGIVQISHGMAEHARRYDNFAKFLNKNGYVVFGDDHRAHGMTSTKQSEKGTFGYHKGDIYNDTVSDLLFLTDYFKNKYSLPLIYLGHSYGSMLGQRYLQHENNASGVILVGSAMMKGPLLGLGCGVSKLLHGLFGGDNSANLLNSMTFGSYNAPFKKDGYDFAWLSRDKDQVRKYIIDEQCGEVMSIAFFKSFLNGLSKSYVSSNLDKIKKDMPIAIYSGKKDPVGGKNGALVTKLFNMYNKIGVKNITIKLYDDARHEILNETNRNEVYDDILSSINTMIA